MIHKSAAIVVFSVFALQPTVPVWAQSQSPGALSNLARGKPTTQSSTGWGGIAGKAVDGNTNGHFSAGSTTHTNKEAQPWWQVDLGALSKIYTVAVWNRTDGSSDRLANFDVKVSNDGNNWESYHVPTQALSPTRVSVGRNGRYVRVQLRGNNYLSLAEVEVFGPSSTATPLARAIWASATVTSILSRYRGPMTLLDLGTGIAAAGMTTYSEFEALKRGLTFGSSSTFGDLVPIKDIKDAYLKAVEGGLALPGEKDPTDLKDEKCARDDKGCVEPLERYRQLLPNVNGFAQYAWKNVLGHKKQRMPKDGLARLSFVRDLLYDYGCRSISRRMPGYARVITIDVPKSSPDALVKDWESEEGDDLKGQGKEKTKGPKSVGEHQTPPKEETIEVCIVTHRQLGETLKKDLVILSLPLVGTPGGKKEPPIAVSLGVYDYNMLFGEIVTALSSALRLKDGQAISAVRAITPFNYCKPYGGPAVWIQDSNLAPPQLVCLTKFRVKLENTWRPPCSEAVLGFGRTMGAALLAAMPAKSTRPLTCTVDWDAACHETFRLPRNLPMGAKHVKMMQFDMVECVIHPMNVASWIGQRLSQVDISTVLPGNDDLKGQTFSLIARRLAGFTRKGGLARVFERYVNNVDPKTIRLPEDSIPAALGGDAKEQNAGSPRRINRAVLRRHVDQWTDGYEYEQMTGYLKKRKLQSGAGPSTAEPQFGIVSPTIVTPKSIAAQSEDEPGEPPELLAALKRVAAANPRKDSPLWDYYRATEKMEQEAFWKDCTELRDVCQIPTASERDACMACAVRAVKEHCVEGKNEKGACKGGTLVKDLVWQLNMWGANGKASCREAAVRTTAIRYFFGIRAPPDNHFILDRGMQSFNALPISAWQRCYLWTPVADWKKSNGTICDDTFGKPATTAIDALKDPSGSFTGRFALMIRAATDAKWAIHLTPLFSVALANPAVKTTVPQHECIAAFPAPGSAEMNALLVFMRPMCAGGQKLACALEAAIAIENKLNEQAGSSANLGDVGNDIADSAEPIIGKLLGMLINAAGMTEMMKTLAQAAGLTGEQASDCEDPEYRTEQLKIVAGSPQDNKRGCLTKVFAKNFGDVLESLIIMLGNKLVDWGVELLKAALQGVKSALISVAGSVPFVGGVLAVLVDVAWYLAFDIGMKMLLKGLVVAQLPKWLKIKELSKLAVEKFVEHPILAVVIGTVLQLLNAAVQYGNKSWLEVGGATIITAVQKFLEAAAAKGNAEARFWHRALTYAKKDFIAKDKGNEGAGLPEIAKRLLVSMVKGFQAAVERNITNKTLKERFTKTVNGIIDDIGGKGDFVEMFKGNPLTTIKSFLTKLADVVVPLVLTFVKVPPWVRDTVEAFIEAFLALTEKTPSAATVVGHIASIAKPLGEPLIRMAKIGNRPIEDALGIAYGKLVSLLMGFKDVKPVDPTAQLLDLALGLLDAVPPIVADQIRDSRLEPEKKLLEAALKELFAMVRARKAPAPPDLLKMLGRILKEYAPARLAALLQGTGLDDLARDGASGFFGKDGPFENDKFFGSPPKWFDTPAAKDTLTKLRERLGQLLVAQKVGEGNPAVKNLLTSALGNLDGKRIVWILGKGRPVSEAFSDIIWELGEVILPRFGSFFGAANRARIVNEFFELVDLVSESCRGKEVWDAFIAKLPEVVNGIFSIVKRLVAERISHPAARALIAGLLDLAREALRNPAALSTTFVPGLAELLGKFFTDAFVSQVPPGFVKNVVGALMAQLVNVIQDPTLKNWKPEQAVEALVTALIGAKEVPPFLKGIYDAVKGKGPLLSQFGGAK